MMLWEHRTGFGDTRSLLVMAAFGGAAGTVLGTWILTVGQPAPGLAIAALVLAYIVVSLRRPDFRLEPARGLKWLGPSGRSEDWSTEPPATVARSSGPFSTARIGAFEFRVRLTVPFLVFGSIQVLTLLAWGLHSGSNYPSLWAILPVLIVIRSEPVLPAASTSVLRAHRDGLAGLAAIRLLLSVFASRASLVTRWNRAYHPGPFQSKGGGTGGVL